METIICIAILGVQLGLFIYIKWSVEWSVGNVLRIQEKNVDILKDFLDTIKVSNEINELTNKVIERQTNAIKAVMDGVQAIMEQEARRNMTSAELIDEIIKKSMKHE